MRSHSVEIIPVISHPRLSLHLQNGRIMSSRSRKSKIRSLVQLTRQNSPIPNSLVDFPLPIILHLTANHLNMCHTPSINGQCAASGVGAPGNLKSRKTFPDDSAQRLASIFEPHVSESTRLFFPSDKGFTEEVTQRWTTWERPSFIAAIKPATEEDVAAIVRHPNHGSLADFIRSCQSKGVRPVPLNHFAGEALFPQQHSVPGNRRRTWRRDWLRDRQKCIEHRPEQLQVC